MIGGNVTALVQKKTSTAKNSIGEAVETWTDAGTVLGWLDFQSGENDVKNYNAKIQETTHIFICDWSAWVAVTGSSYVTAENGRLVFNTKVYNILMIDDPMNLHQHIEVYLKYVGGGLGG